MRWGFGYGCYYSDPESDIIVLRDTNLGSGVARTFFPIAGRSQYYQLVIDGKNSGPPIYVKAGQVTTFKGNYALTQGPHFISIVGVGPWSTPNFFDVSTVQSSFASNRANRIHLEITAKPSQFSLLGVGGNGGLTNWDVSGMVRFQNCRPQANRPTWGELDLTLTSNTGGAYSEDSYGSADYAGGEPSYLLEASLNGEVVFSGSCAGDGTINLYDATDTFVGTVDLVFAGDFDSAIFVTNWPAAYYIYWKLNTNWVANDFPANVTHAVTAALWAANVATLTIGAHVWTVGTAIVVTGILPAGYNQSVIITAVTATTISFALAKNPGVYVSGGTVTRKPQAIKYDDGRSGTFSFDSYPHPTLPAGSYHVVCHQVSDTGEESAGVANLVQVISQVPKAPTNLAYVSSGPLHISFTASTDAASTYDGYDSNCTGVIDTLDAPSVTHIAGVGTLTLAFPALTDAGFTGDRYILIRSKLGGVQSGNCVVFIVTYLAGVVVLVRANAPQPGRFTTAGRLLTVKWSLDTLNQLEIPTAIKIFLATSEDGFNYAAPDGTATIDGTGRIRFGEISATSPGDGNYWFAIRSDSANGQSQNTDVYGPIALNTIIPADPTFTIRGGI